MRNQSKIRATWYAISLETFVGAVLDISYLHWTGKKTAKIKKTKREVSPFPDAANFQTVDIPVQCHIKYGVWELSSILSFHLTCKLVTRKINPTLHLFFIRCVKFRVAERLRSPGAPNRLSLNPRLLSRRTKHTGTVGAFFSRSQPTTNWNWEAWKFELFQQLNSCANISFRWSLFVFLLLIWPHVKLSTLINLTLFGSFDYTAPSRQKDD